MSRGASLWARCLRDCGGDADSAAMLYALLEGLDPSLAHEQRASLRRADFGVVNGGADRQDRTPDPGAHPRSR